MRSKLLTASSSPLSSSGRNRPLDRPLISRITGRFSGTARPSCGGRKWTSQRGTVPAGFSTGRSPPPRFPRHPPLIQPRDPLRPQVGVALYPCPQRLRVLPERPCGGGEVAVEGAEGVGYDCGGVLGGVHASFALARVT